MMEYFTRFGLLTGGAGRGRTTVIRTWAAGLLIGDSSKSEIITADIAMQAINDCELG